jgi:ABC-type multidrug transport system permease subunit
MSEMTYSALLRADDRQRTMAALVLHQFGYDLRGLLRDRQARFFTLALPVLFLVIFASVFGGKHNTVAVAGGSIDTSAYYVPGIITLGIVAAQPVTQAVLLPLYFISGVFVPISSMPHWLVDVANVFPIRHLAAALLTAYNPHATGSGFAGTDLLVVAGWGLAGLLIALRRFSWLPLGR